MTLRVCSGLVCYCGTATSFTVGIGQSSPLVLAAVHCVLQQERHGERLWLLVRISARRLRVRHCFAFIVGCLCASCFDERKQACCGLP